MKKKKENSDYIEISNIFEQKSPIYKKVLRPYAVGFGIRAESIDYGKMPVCPVASSVIVF